MANSESSPDPIAPIIPDPSQRMEVVFFATPHPAVIDPQVLLEECDLRTQRRSGPGGQHRNKTSSGAFLNHKPSGIVGEATERRSQAQNRNVALQRLRFRLAVELRTPSVIDTESVGGEAELRQLYYGKSLRLADANEAKPALLAMILNDLHASGGQPSAVAPVWAASTSAVVALIKSHHAAFAFVNQVRIHHGRRPLKS